MAVRRIEMMVIMILVAVLSWGTMAQSNCNNVIVSLSPCLDYITGNSSTPSSGCCNQLASVVKSQAQCLCEVIGGGSSMGVSINQTRALALPTACNVQTPDISRCNATSPSGTPSGPSGSNPKTPSGGSSSSGGGDASDGCNTKLSLHQLFFVILIASLVSIFAL